MVFLASERKKKKDKRKRKRERKEREREKKRKVYAIRRRVEKWLVSSPSFLSRPCSKHPVRWNGGEGERRKK